MDHKSKKDRSVSKMDGNYHPGPSADKMTPNSSEGQGHPDWSQLSDAYGDASGTDRMLLMLISPDQEQRQQAVDDEILSFCRACSEIHAGSPQVLDEVAKELSPKLTVFIQ